MRCQACCDFRWRPLCELQRDCLMDNHIGHDVMTGHVTPCPICDTLQQNSILEAI